MVSGLHSEAQGAFSDDANSKRACQTGCHQEQIAEHDHSTFWFISVAFANSMRWPGKCGHQLLNILPCRPELTDVSASSGTETGTGSTSGCSTLSTSTGEGTLSSRQIPLDSEGALCALFSVFLK